MRSLYFYNQEPFFNSPLNSRVISFWTILCIPRFFDIFYSNFFTIPMLNSPNFPTVFCVTTIIQGSYLPSFLYYAIHDSCPPFLENNGYWKLYRINNQQLKNK